MSANQNSLSVYVSRLSCSITCSCKTHLWTRVGWAGCGSARVCVHPELKLCAAMWGFISYLNSPELVASFQRCCGLVPRETCSYVSQNGVVQLNGSVKDSPVTIHQRKAEQVANGTSRAHDSNSNYKSASSQCETKGDVSKSDLNETLHLGELKSRGFRMQRLCF